MGILDIFKQSQPKDPKARSKVVIQQKLQKANGQSSPITIEQSDEELKAELNELKLQALMKKVAEQEIIIRRLLDLVVMNIEHKAYDKILLPQINAIKNLLDKR